LTGTGRRKKKKNTQRPPKRCAIDICVCENLEAWTIYEIIR
jgi:hypothetical protein